MATLKDLAEKSGFSITTVSRALAGYSDVSERTRQHIEAIALAEGYQPNMLARQLRARKTDTIGMIIPSVTDRFADDFFSELVMSVGHAATHYHFDMLVSAKAASDEMDAYRRIVGGNRVDGVILARLQRHDLRIAYLRTTRCPFVVFGRAAPDEESEFAYVDVDSQSGIHQIMNHLIGLGHQRIGLLLPPQELAITPYRLRGYQQGLDDAGLPYRSDRIIFGDLSRVGGRSAAEHLLAQQPDITAIVASNDLMAIGAIQAVQARQMQVGRDIAITGYDNIPAAEYTQPGLTTVRQPIQEIGQRLLQMLIQIIHQESDHERQVLLSPELVIRESCGAGQRGGEGL